MIFADLYQSAMGKAARLGSSVHGVTLGPNAREFTYEEPMLVEPHVLRSSTPKELHIPNISSIKNYFEILSAKEVERTALRAELTKNRRREADARVLNLEKVAKRQEEGVVRRMSRLYEEERLKQKTYNANLQKKEQIYQNPNDDRHYNINAENRAQERNEKMKMHLEEARKSMEKQKMAGSAAAWEAIFYPTYDKILKIMRECSDQKKINELIMPYFSNLESCAQFAQNLKIKTRNGDLTEMDLKHADTVLKNLKKILGMITVGADKINCNMIEEQKKAEENERLRKEKEKRQEDDMCKKFSDDSSLKLLAELRQILYQARKDLEPLLKDKQMDQYRFHLQKAASVPVNAISANTPQQMMDKYRKLSALLSGSRIEGCSVTTQDHPLGSLFVKELLARLFVNQAEIVVSSRSDAAYPIASILVNLWAEFPDFGTLVRAHFFDKCPYLVPAFWPRFNEQNEAEYFKLIGYEVKNGKIEDQEMFLKRMEGIMRLYGSILIISPRDPNLQTPLGLAEAWRWAAAFLNIEPRADISPVMLVSFLEVVGNDLWQFYGRQFKKMLAYICKDYLPILEQNTPKNRRGPLTRFETFLESAVKTGNIVRPAKILPPNFW